MENNYNLFIKFKKNFLNLNLKKDNLDSSRPTSLMGLLFSYSL